MLPEAPGRRVCCGVARFALRSPVSTRFQVAVLSQPAALLQSLATDITSAAGVCGQPFELFDSVDSGGQCLAAGAPALPSYCLRWRPIGVSDSDRSRATIPRPALRPGARRVACGPVGKCCYHLPGNPTAILSLACASSGQLHGGLRGQRGHIYTGNRTRRCGVYLRYWTFRYG